MRHSGLPGVRINDKIVLAFMDACRPHGPRALDLLERMARLTDDRAPGGSPYEILPVCGVMGLAAVSERKPEFAMRVVPVWSDAADDSRFRVREAVPAALALVAPNWGMSTLLQEVSHWGEHYFQYTALLLTVSRKEIAPLVRDAAVQAELVDHAFTMVRKAPRSAERYPGYKALIETIPRAATALALAHGPAVVDVLLRWASDKDVETRDLALASIQDKRFRARFADEVRELEQKNKAAKPVPRDGKKRELPTRKRSKGR